MTAQQACSDANSPAAEPSGTKNHADCERLLRESLRQFRLQPADAADVLQATRLEEVNRPAKEVSAREAWLRQVCRSKVLNLLRDRQRRAAAALQDVIGTAQEPRSLVEDPAVLLERQELCDQVRAAVTALADGPDDLNVRLFTMRYWDGLKPREMATATGLTPRQVSRRLSWFIAKLRRTFGVDISSYRGGVSVAGHHDGPRRNFSIFPSDILRSGASIEIEGPVVRIGEMGSSRRVGRQCARCASVAVRELL